MKERQYRTTDHTPRNRVLGQEGTW